MPSPSVRPDYQPTSMHMQLALVSQACQSQQKEIQSILKDLERAYHPLSRGDRVMGTASLVRKGISLWLRSRLSDLSQDPLAALAQSEFNKPKGSPSLSTFFMKQMLSPLKITEFAAQNVGLLKVMAQRVGEAPDLQRDLQDMKRPVNLAGVFVKILGENPEPVATQVSQSIVRFMTIGMSSGVNIDLAKTHMQNLLTSILVGRVRPEDLEEHAKVLKAVASGANISSGQSAWAKGLEEASRSLRERVQGALAAGVTQFPYSDFLRSLVDVVGGEDRSGKKGDFSHMQARSEIIATTMSIAWSSLGAMSHFNELGQYLLRQRDQIGKEVSPEEQTRNKSDRKALFRSFESSLAKSLGGRQTNEFIAHLHGMIHADNGSFIDLISAQTANFLRPKSQASQTISSVMQENSTNYQYTKTFMSLFLKNIGQDTLHTIKDGIAEGKGIFKACLKAAGDESNRNFSSKATEFMRANPEKAAEFLSALSMKFFKLEEKHTPALQSGFAELLKDTKLDLFESFKILSKVYLDKGVHNLDLVQIGQFKELCSKISQSSLKDVFRESPMYTNLKAGSMVAAIADFVLGNETASGVIHQGVQGVLSAYELKAQVSEFFKKEQGQYAQEGAIGYTASKAKDAVTVGLGVASVALDVGKNLGYEVGATAVSAVWSVGSAVSGWWSGYGADKVEQPSLSSSNGGEAEVSRDTFSSGKKDERASFSVQSPSDERMRTTFSDPFSSNHSHRSLSQGACSQVTRGRDLSQDPGARHVLG